MAKGSIDELALVKAAAWAWYQHGSGCDGRPVREFDVQRTNRLPRPSRYKLEAMRNTASSLEEEEEEEDGSGSVSLSPSHTDISLLDSYEIESISRQLRRLLASAGASSLGGYVAVDGRDGMRRRRSSSKKEMISGKVNGFWARHAIGFCTSRGDVLEAATALRGRPRRKSGSSLRLADFRP